MRFSIECLIPFLFPSPIFAFDLPLNCKKRNTNQPTILINFIDRLNLDIFQNNLDNVVTLILHLMFNFDLTTALYLHSQQ